MEVGEYRLSVDAVSKFFNTLYVTGWFHHETQTLTEVTMIGADLIGIVSRIGIAHAGVEHSFGAGKGFCLQALRSTDKLSDMERLQLVFVTSDATVINLPLKLLVEDRDWHNRSHALSSDFVARVRESSGARLLDVGGRSRSRVDRKNQFPGLNVVVLDILPGENVDVVGDAHKMSDFFPEGHFDFVYSVSVFEHLAMPWKVVCEMNRVMKPGGLGLVHSHQTIGMHDMPWDFYRFSDVAWSGLFNGHTGFEVLGSVMDDLQFVIPFLYKTEKEKAEQSAGFESSTVMFKKVGPCRVSWDVPLSGVVETAYPEE